jgi:ubiquinone/menaquinone biosynthesis C-methylase UbiE
VKRVLDMACGSRMFWFDKKNDETIFVDQRDEDHILCDGRELHIHPDIVADFTSLPFENESFNLVVFDPPHLVNVGKNSWMFKKYGGLQKSWKEDIQDGFQEAFRVLKPNGVLVFKWNEMQILLKDILKLTPVKPLFGHVSGKKSANTHWVCFIK